MLLDISIRPLALLPQSVLYFAIWGEVQECPDPHHKPLNSAFPQVKSIMNALCQLCAQQFVSVSALLAHSFSLRDFLAP